MRFGKWLKSELHMQLACWKWLEHEEFTPGRDRFVFWAYPLVRSFLGSRVKMVLSGQGWKL